MGCTRCGREVRPGASFCPHCGEPAPTADEAGTAALPTAGGAAPATSTFPSPPPGAAGPQPYPGPPPGSQFGSEPSGGSSSPADKAAGISSGLLGAVVAGLLGVLLTLPDLIASLNEDGGNKAALVILVLLVVLAAGAVTALLVMRSLAARKGRQDPGVVPSIATGLGVFVTVYGLIVWLTIISTSGDRL